MSSYLLDSYPEKERERRVAFSFEYAHDPVAAISVGNVNTSDLKTLSGLAWYDNRAFHASPVSLNFLNNAILGANTRKNAKTNETGVCVEVMLCVSFYMILCVVLVKICVCRCVCDSYVLCFYLYDPMCCIDQTRCLQYVWQ